MRLIDADELKRAIMLKDNANEETWEQLYDSVLDEIDNATTVCGNNPKWCESCVSNGKCASTRQTGEWIKITKDGTVPVEYICSKCGRKIFDNSAHIVPINEFYPFCHCGADMRG